MATLLIKEQTIVLSDDNAELCKNLLRALNISCSIRVGFDGDYTIRNLMDEVSVRASNTLRRFVDFQDDNKDCLYFISNYRPQDFARVRNVGPKIFNEVLDILKLHGYDWK